MENNYIINFSEFRKINESKSNIIKIKSFGNGDELTKITSNLSHDDLDDILMELYDYDIDISIKNVFYSSFGDKSRTWIWKNIPPFIDIHPGFEVRLRQNSLDHQREKEVDFKFIYKRLQSMGFEFLSKNIKFDKKELYINIIDLNITINGREDKSILSEFKKDEKGYYEPYELEHISSVFFNEPYCSWLDNKMDIDDDYYDTIDYNDLFDMFVNTIKREGFDISIIDGEFRFYITKKLIFSLYSGGSPKSGSYVSEYLDKVDFQGSLLIDDALRDIEPMSPDI